MNVSGIVFNYGNQLGKTENNNNIDPKLICQPIYNYHKALSDKNLSSLEASISDSIYRVYIPASNDFSNYEPWIRLSKSQILQNYSHAFARKEFFYKNEIMFKSIMLNDLEAFVKTKETGKSWKDQLWFDTEALWHVSRSGKRNWKIKGHIHRID